MGVIMDAGLRYENHIAEVVRNCFYRLKVLYRIRNFLSEDLRVRMCEVLVLSKLNYADLVYGPRLLARTERLVQRVQNACARYCFVVPPRHHVSPYLNKAGLLKMTYRRELHLAVFLFGLIKSRTPPYLYNKLRWRHESRGTKSRQISLQLAIPGFRTATFRGSFKYAATKCWNNLPPPFRELTSVLTFKKTYKTHLMNHQRELPAGGRVVPTYLMK